jgi:hypothetical protein
MNKQESTGREVALEAEVAELKTQLVEERNRSMGYTNELEKLRSEKEASSGPCGCQAYRDLEEKVATMPVIPRDVAIAIFREGQRHGYNNKSVAENLTGLCEREGFECRIHGIDDIEKS